MSQRKLTTDQIRDYINTHVQYLDWGLVVQDDEGGRPYLQIHFDAPDSDYLPSPESMVVQKCRKWFLSPFMTDTELVRTAHKAVRAAVEHEADENFKFDGAAIFSPHTDVELLWRARMEPLNPDDTRK